MKDALGHGSDNRGGGQQQAPAHQGKVNQVGRPVTLSPAVLATIQNNPGGFSITPKGQQPESGYMVSIPGHTQIVNEADLAGPHSQDIMNKYASDHADALSRTGAHIGGWTNKDEGKTYLDVSQNIKNKNAAVNVGTKRNQIAIWDVKKSREIPTGGTGK
jgi:hypothetical protein